MTLRLLMARATGAPGETRMRLVLNEAARRLALGENSPELNAAFEVQVILDGSKEALHRLIEASGK